jgi:hypothetical protein
VHAEKMQDKRKLGAGGGVGERAQTRGKSTPCVRQIIRDVVVLITITR